MSSHKNEKKRRQLAELFEKYKGRCQYCNCPTMIPPRHIKGNQKYYATRDHIIPQVRGGSDNIDNLTLACSRCNFTKENAPLRIWLKRIEIGYYKTDWWHSIPHLLEKHLTQLEQANNLSVSTTGNNSDV